MGAWSHESFGNDDACDWVAELQEGTSLRPVESAFDEVIDAGDDYLEAPQACVAIAAAEVVARLRGRFGLCDAYSERIDQWVARVELEPAPPLIAKARLALERVLAEPSELLELWEDSHDSSEWRAAVTDLASRVGS